MALEFYNQDQDLFDADPLVSFHDGRNGDTHEQKIYIKNNDITKWYTNITIDYRTTGSVDLGALGVSAWGIKFIPGTRQPTEAEWENVFPGVPVVLEDIGDNSAGNTDTYYPIWVRVTCPGDQDAQIRELSTIVLSFDEKVVGS